MVDTYKQQITERIKDSINNWIEELKVKHSELLLTKQWNVQFPKGFVSGHNVIPVVTGSKKGKHLVGEVQFLLPESLELEIDSVELALKNEPFAEKKNAQKKLSSSVPIDEPLDILNDMIVGLNAFLSGIQLPASGQTNINPLLHLSGNSTPISGINGRQSPVQTISSTNTDEVIKELMQTRQLPEWFAMIESIEVRTELIRKIAEALIHYRKQTGRQVPVREFLEQYNKHLLSQGKLHYFCKYKAKPIKLDEHRHCEEHYCTKKPYNSQCPHAALKFGAVNPGDY